MKNDQYFKLETSFQDNFEVDHLIDILGMEGFGVYVALLLNMRKDDELVGRLSAEALRPLGRRWNVEVEVIEKVIREFHLFVVDEAEGRFSSEYLDRVMVALWKKRGDKIPDRFNCKPSNVKRAVNGRFTDDGDSRVKQSKKDVAKDDREKADDVDKNVGMEEAQKVASNKKVGKKGAQKAISNMKAVKATAARWTGKMKMIDADSVGQLPIEPIKSCEKMVDDMNEQQSWMEMIGMKSGWGKLFVEYRKPLLDIFKEHIRLYAKERKLVVLDDVRNYFAHCMAAGARTCELWREQILRTFVGGEEKSEYRFETVVDGHRMYLGRMIPPGAPPRPSVTAVWDDQKCSWGR